MNKYIITIISKDESFQMNENDLNDCRIIHKNFIKNNRDNITKVYNNVLDQILAMNDENVFSIFMHADVTLNMTSVLDKIDATYQKYDVIGLCGCSKFSISHSPLNWFTGSIGNEKHRWGCVTHGEIGNATTFFNSHSPNVIDHEVACIDGVFIAFNYNAIKALRFNENIRFNCYDTQISMECVLNKKLKLGVVVEKSLQHYSVGKQILNDDFKIDENILREQYQQFFK